MGTETLFQATASFGRWLAVSAALATAVPARADDGIAKGNTSSKKIAFSNSYAGNSFRQVMIKSFLDMGAQAKKDHLIGDVTVVSANNSVTEQASQMQNLIGSRQMVEIARAFSVTDKPVQCVILDEPTSALGHEAARQLLTHVRRAAGLGTACILITHRLDEIMAVCARAVVMVDGRVVAERPIAGLTRSALVSLMGAIEAPREWTVSRATRESPAGHLW